MAKKKSAARKNAGKATKRKKPAKKTGRKKAVKKSPAKKKAAKKKKTAAKRTAKKKSVRKPAAKKTAKRKKKSLGRAKISADAKLDVIFQKDYQAREVFAFLRVATVRELEEHAPDEIIEQMTRPLVHTVNRIRKALALANRSLAGDEKFALQFLAELQQRKR